MALTINDTSYAGKLVLPYLNASILDAESLTQRYVTLLDGGDDAGLTMNIGGLDDSPAFEAYTCDFVSGTDVKIDPRVLALSKFKMDHTFCITDFQAHWQADRTGAKFNDQQTPPEYEEWLIGFLLGKAKEQMEYNIWQGNFSPTGGTATYDDFNGVLFHLDAASTTVKVDLLDATDGTTQITALAVAEDVTFNMQRALDNLPRPLRGKYQDVRIFVSPVTFDLYYQHQAAQGLDYRFQTSTLTPKFLGYDVVAVPGMADDTIVMGRSSNLFFGTRSEADFNEILLKNMKEVDLSDNVRFRMQFMAGTQVAVPEDVVIVYPAAV